MWVGDTVLVRGLPAVRGLRAVSGHRHPRSPSLLLGGGGSESSDSGPSCPGSERGVGRTKGPSQEGTRSQAQAPGAHRCAGAAESGRPPPSHCQRLWVRKRVPRVRAVVPVWNTHTGERTYRGRGCSFLQVVCI